MCRFLALLLLCAAGCAKPLPPAPPLVDAADGAAVVVVDVMPDPSGCTAACANLRHLSCPEGLASNCIASCQHGSQISNMNTGCLADAGSQAAARACGSLGPSGCSP